MRPRAGFTLLEIVIAVSVFSVVMAALMQAFFSTQRTQNMTVSANLLKVAGQKAIQTMYLELSQARKLLASTTQDPPARDLGREYFALFEGITGTIPAGNMKFPRIDVDGGFGVPGSASGELERTSVGNTLAFVTSARTIKVATPWITITGMSGFLGLQALSDTPYYMTPVRFVTYYLGEKPLPAGIVLNRTRTSTQQLMRWESHLYIERAEFQSLLDKLAGAPLSSVAVWNDLKDNHGIKGVWDRGAATAAASLMTMNGLGALVPMPAPRAVSRWRSGQIAQTNLEPYAVGMVSFNTGVDFRPIVDGQVMPVPAYGPTDSAHVNIPFGFETAIVGPNSGRLVLLRLALAAKPGAGGRLYGHSHQEVVKVFDM